MAPVKKEEEVEVETELDLGVVVEPKPGQKYPTPTPGFADRVFYETLYRQKPDSVMAQDWCLAYGVLPADEAKKLNDKVCKRKGGKPSASPAKASRASQPAAKKRRAAGPKVVNADPDGDTGFDASGAFEGVGATGI